MSARRTDPQARVMVFVDGQNVFKTCVERYGRGTCHPALLARQLPAGRTFGHSCYCGCCQGMTFEARSPS